MPDTVSMHGFKSYRPKFYDRQIPLCVWYRSPIWSLPWSKPSGRSALQSRNVLVSEECYPVVTPQCWTWNFEGRWKICSIPAMGSILNSLDHEDSCDGAVSEVLSKWGSRWTAVVCFKKFLVEASQLAACASQITAGTRAYASYSCSFQQCCGRSLRSWGVSSVCCWGQVSLRKLLLHLNLKAVLFLIRWGRNLYSLLPGSGVITFSDCSNLPWGVDGAVAPMSSKWRSCRDSRLADLKRMHTKLKFGGEIH